MLSYNVKKTPGDTVWFRHDRFGMFIHFGLYSMPARNEWVKNHEYMTDEQYDKYFKYFNCDLFDADEWARRAKEAGMKYAILTTKHHDGFCNFDSAYTDYKITNTAYGKDLVKEFADAFRRHGLRVGFYYSLLDWHHPDFTIDSQHPQRNEKNALELNKEKDMKKYTQYMRDQVTELLTNYGKIDIMWFDFSYPDVKCAENPLLGGKGKDDWEAEKLLELTRSLAPDIIIDNRTGIEQDVWTPEQYQMHSWLKHPQTGELVTWEACHTFSGSWGYYRDEMSWKKPETLINILIRTVAYGGNLLMNVGPTARGCFDSRAENALAVYAEWMKYNSRSIYGCTMAEARFKAPEGCLLTQSDDGKRLYIHLVEYPFAHLELPDMADKVEYVQFLHDASEITYTVGCHNTLCEGASDMENLLILNIPQIRPDVTVPVLEVFLK